MSRPLKFDYTVTFFDQDGEVFGAPMTEKDSYYVIVDEMIKSVMKLFNCVTSFELVATRVVEEEE